MKNALFFATFIFTLFTTALSAQVAPDSTSTFYSFTKEGTLQKTDIKFYFADGRRVIEETDVKDTLTILTAQSQVLNNQIQTLARDLSSIAGHKALISQVLTSADTLQNRFGGVIPTILDTTGISVLLASSFSFREDKVFTQNFSFKLNKKEGLRMFYDKTEVNAIYTPYLLRLRKWDGRNNLDFFPTADKDKPNRIIWKSLEGYTIVQKLPNNNR